jgi:hypothetical protein
LRIALQHIFSVFSAASLIIILLGPKLNQELRHKLTQRMDMGFCSGIQKLVQETV